MKQHIFLITITIFEALIGIWVKLIDNSIPIFTLNFYRVFFGFLIVSFIVPFIDKINFNKENLKSNIIIGLLIALQISVFNIAMKYVPVANVVLFWSINPIFVFIYSALFLKEKVKKSHIIMFVMGFIGLLISEPFSGSEESIIGNIFALTSSFVYATLITFMRRNKQDKSSNVFWYMLVASIALLPSIFIFGTGNLFSPESIEIGKNSFSLPPIIWVLGLGMISTGLVYILMRFTLSNITAGLYSIFDVVVSPLAAGVFAYLILSEKPQENVIYGGAILLLTALWLNLSMIERKKRLGRLRKIFK